MYLALVPLIFIVILVLITIIGFGIGFTIRNAGWRRNLLISGYVLGGYLIANGIVHYLSVIGRDKDDNLYIAIRLAIGFGIIFLSHLLSSKEKPEIIIKRTILWGLLTVSFTLVIPSIIRIYKNFLSSYYQPLDMEWSYVPAGTFLMGSQITDSMAEKDEFPEHEIYLDAYEINTYEVLNKEYAQCMMAGICKGPERIWDETTVEELLISPDVSIGYVMFEQANTFCNWIGGRLPTEAEWEKAARGGLDQQLFPWGNEIPVCNEGAINGALFYPCSAFISPENNGYYSANGYGIFDMAGSRWEWAQDLYSKDYYEMSPTDNPFGPKLGLEHVLRGGSWDDEVEYIRVASRAYHTSPEIKYISNYGFRCVRDPANIE